MFDSIIECSKDSEILCNGWCVRQTRFAHLKVKEEYLTRVDANYFPGIAKLVQEYHRVRAISVRYDVICKDKPYIQMVKN